MQITTPGTRQMIVCLPYLLRDRKYNSFEGRRCVRIPPPTPPSYPAVSLHKVYVTREGYPTLSERSDRSIEDSVSSWPRLSLPGHFRLVLKIDNRLSLVETCGSIARRAPSKPTIAVHDVRLVGTSAATAALDGKSAAE